MIYKQSLIIIHLNYKIVHKYINHLNYLQEFVQEKIMKKPCLMSIIVNSKKAQINKSDQKFFFPSGLLNFRSIHSKKICLSNNLQFTNMEKHFEVGHIQNSRFNHLVKRYSMFLTKPSTFLFSNQKQKHLKQSRKQTSQPEQQTEQQNKQNTEDQFGPLYFKKQYRMLKQYKHGPLIFSIFDKTSIGLIIFLIAAVIYAAGFLVYPTMITQLKHFDVFMEIVNSKQGQIKELLNKLASQQYQVKSFIQDSVSTELTELFNSPFIHQTVYLAYGPEGIGKSTTAKHFANQKIKNGQPVLYVNLAQIKQATKNHQQLIDTLLSQTDFAKLVYYLITNYSLFKRLYELKFQKQLLKGNRLVIIIDQIDLLKSYIKSSPQKFEDAIRKIYSLHATGGKIIVLSSDKQFCIQNFFKVPTISGNKIVFSEINHATRQSLKKTLQIQGASINAQSLILNHHSIRGQMQPSLNAYNHDKILHYDHGKMVQNVQNQSNLSSDSQNAIEKPPMAIKLTQDQKIQKLKARLNQDLNQARLLIQNSLLKNNRSQKQNILMQICENKRETPKQNKKSNLGIQMAVQSNQRTKLIKKQLEESNILLYNKFRSKIILRGFEQYAKEKMNKGKRFKCYEQYFNI